MSYLSSYFCLLACRDGAMATRLFTECLTFRFALLDVHSKGGDGKGTRKEGGPPPMLSLMLLENGMQCLSM